MTHSTHQERLDGLLALALAFCSMATIFVLKTYADASFLTIYGPTRLPELLTLQALALIAISLSYSALVKPIRPLRLDLLLISALISCAFAAPFLLKGGNHWPFVTVLLLLVLPAATHLVLWNTVSNTVSGRHARRFLPRAGAAATLGAVLGSLGASFLVANFSVQGLAPFAATIALFALFLRLALHYRLPPPSHIPAHNNKQHTTQALSPSLRRLVFYLVLATFIESFVAAIIEFGFKREASLRFNLPELAHFFALFYLVSNLLLLLLQWFGSAFLLTVRPLRQSLALTPSLLLISAFFWFLWPTLIMACLTRMTESTIKFGVARPGQEIALLPLAPLERSRWKVLLRGTFVQAGSAMAGLALLFSVPLLATYPRLLAVTLIVLCLLWLYLQKHCAQAYLEAMGNALGLRKLSSKHSVEPQIFDRDGLGKLVDLLDQADRQQASFAQEVLSGSEHQANALIPHLAHAGPAGRMLLYRMIANHPKQQKMGRNIWQKIQPSFSNKTMRLLRDTVQQETAPALLAFGLAALAARQDVSATAQARALIQQDQNFAVYGWEYLVRSGMLRKCEQLGEIPCRILRKNGPKAAWLLQTAVRNGCLDSAQAEQMILATIADPNIAHHTEGLRAAAAYDLSQTLTLFTQGLASQDIAISFALPELAPATLSQLVQQIHAQENPATRARLVRALQPCTQAKSTELIASFLADPSRKVRQLAIHSLRRKRDKNGVDIPRKLLNQPLKCRLNQFSTYIQGYQAGAQKTPEKRLLMGEILLKRDEILAEICGLLALMGDPRSIQAAQRGLLTGNENYQRHCLDILQEVVHGRQRKKLIHLLERVIDKPSHENPSALREICATDPWLAQCHTGKLAVQPLLALRATELFANIDSAILLKIASQSTKWHYPPNHLIICQGEKGNALYVVLSGHLSVEKDGLHLYTLHTNDSFGELALLEQGLRQATVRTLESTTLLCIPGIAFKQTLEEYPSFGINICKTLAKWVRSDS